MGVNGRVAILPSGADRLIVEEIEIHVPAEYEVLIQQHAAGICHSQLHLIHQERPLPIVMGHEASGVVLATGSAVTHVQEGDEVLITWLPRSGRPDARAPGVPVLERRDGSVVSTHNVFTWATHSLADEQYVVKAPEGAPKATSAIIGCAVMTGAGAVLNSAAVKPGQSVVVIGTGGVGLCAVAAAQCLGASPIVAVDLDDSKLDLARRLGADLTFNSSSTDNVIEEIRRAMPAGKGAAGADFVFDCVGRPQTVSLAIALARNGRPAICRGGTIVVVGVPVDGFEVVGIDLLGGEKAILGSLGGSCTPERDFPTFVDWTSSGQLDLDQIVTGTYTLDDINTAIDDLESGRVLGRAILDFS